MLLQYENLIRQLDCKVTVPYWDWSLVSAQPFNNSFWSEKLYGFGANGVGDPPCVNTGQQLSRKNKAINLSPCRPLMGKRILLSANDF